VGNERSEERNFVSMILFPNNNGTRLVQVRALQGNFPYYGSLETLPETAGMNFRNGQEALVDKTLMLQFDAKVGDSIKVGAVNFLISGTLIQAPGQTGFAASVAPVVYIPLKYVEQTGLSQKGSRINYKYYYKIGANTDIVKLEKEIEPKLEKEELRYETVASQKEDTGRAFSDLTSFLSLVGFIALLLGCIGVASAIHIYIREKLASIAVLRCLGATSTQAFYIYLIQIASIGLIGSIAGAFLGTIVQQLLPIVLKDFLPVDINVNISWLSIGQGILLGLIISVLFALLPLVSVRNISPLNTLRLSFDNSSSKRDPVKLLVYGLIVLFIFSFTWIQLKGWAEALVFTAGILIAFLILYGCAALLMFLTRKLIPDNWAYLWRQGFANLYRPNNQTVILIISVGLGTAFICTLFLIQSTLINRVTLSSSGNQPNMVLFDIQAQQKEMVAAMVKQQNLPVLQEVPVVTIKLDEINGITAQEAKKDSTLNIPRWAFTREYRVTYRDTLTASEKIESGKWDGTFAAGDTVPISVEKDYAKRLRVKLGDKLLFNVQGMPVLTKVTSLRTVEWGKIQTNFLVVFPKGSLEEAPQFHVLITRVPDGKASALLQQRIVKSFPNISIVDLGLILSVLDEILDKISFVIRFMAAFSIITGIVVLIASVLISKYQRIQESVLLRTLGASRRQILIITGLEY
ncbi:MAG: FtsX-like permease family protein, partial [Pedobacter sp.]